jgi:hypothetical protein
LFAGLSLVDEILSEPLDMEQEEPAFEDILSCLEADEALLHLNDIQG